jgi:type II secretory pathway component PulC
MSTRHWMMSAATGAALLLTSCATNRTKTQSTLPAPQAFPQPVVPAQPLTLPPVKIAGMIPTTNGNVPLMPVAVGSNRDPFAAPQMPSALRAAIKPASANTIAVKSSPVSTPPAVALPQPQPIRLTSTPMPPLSAGRLPTVQPALPVMPPPPASRPNLANAIVLSGVVQTGSNLSAIVQDTDGTSRYVQVGERLAGGEVTVKRINLNPVGTPSIVFLENGKEWIKSVGSSESSSAL